jgi:hypothetical protein
MRPFCVLIAIATVAAPAAAQTCRAGETGRRDRPLTVVEASIADLCRAPESGG